jgi:cob(I)alamin adenosyltransferase
LHRVATIFWRDEGMSIATRTGDDGTTGLLYGRRVAKTDPRVEACGAVDELNAALGMARAQAAPARVGVEVLAFQKQLVALMGELAVAPEDLPRYRADKLPKLEEIALAHLDGLVARLEGEKISFDGWATPGANLPAAALDVARTVCRRAERRVVELGDGGGLPVRYLNRLSDVLWLLARYCETPE